MDSPGDQMKLFEAGVTSSGPKGEITSSYSKGGHHGQLEVNSNGGEAEGCPPSLHRTARSGKLMVYSCNFVPGRVEYISRCVSSGMACCTALVFGCCLVFLMVLFAIFEGTEAGNDQISTTALIFFVGLPLFLITLCSCFIGMWEVASAIFEGCNKGIVKLGRQRCFHVTDAVFHCVMAIVYGGLALTADVLVIHYSGGAEWLLVIFLHLLALMMWMRTLWAILTVVKIKNGKWVQTDPNPDVVCVVPPAVNNIN